MLTSRILVTLEVWNCSIFVRKCTAINTKRSDEMVDAWQIGEIRWNKQKLLYCEIFYKATELLDSMVSVVYFCVVKNV